MKIRLSEEVLYYVLRFLKGRDHRERGLSRIKPGSIKNILIVSSTAIGDTLMSTPAMRAVRKCFPEARIIALFNRDNMELFANNPNIDGAVPYYGGWKKFISTVTELRRYSFDAALILHGNEPQATPLAYLTGARFIVKLPNVSRFSFLLSNAAPELPWARLGHGIEARLRSAALLGCKPNGLEMDLPLDTGYEEGLRAFMSREGLGSGKREVLIGINPGASTLSRQWFAERFIVLARRLLEEMPGIKIVLTGSPEEAPLCRAIAEGIGEATEAVIAAGRLTLPESAALIGRLNAFVTGDTGPMHIAYALKTPVVALYAVSDPEKTGPLTNRELHRIIKKPQTCQPCISKKYEHQECMEQISVDEVFSAVMDILRKQRRKK